MKWYSVNDFLPGKGVGYVIARVLNSDYSQFIYQAIHMGERWEFWDEEYWPKTRRDDKFKVTHWTYMPELNDSGF